MTATNDLAVPYFRPDVGDQEVEEVVATLRSGWWTTGPRVRRFEQDFAAAVSAAHAVALNSCTAALHLAVEALGLKPRQAVLVPTMTFAATAEVLLYQGAVPVLVDCDPRTGNMDLDDAGHKMCELRSGQLSALIPPDVSVVGMIPVHVGGLMMNVDAIQAFASKHGLWVVEDAAHAIPAAWRKSPEQPWQRCGEGTAAVTCFSFYANKTITTGEGGMATTDDAELAKRIRLMSLHGLSANAWDRYTSAGSWDYQIISPGYKYNLTDLAAAIGLHQLARAEKMRRGRERVAGYYMETLADIEEIELPARDSDRIHSWHLFPVRLRLEKLTTSRNEFLADLRSLGVGCSVHWRPLHLHPYYQETFGWRPDDFPNATGLWERLISLPIFPGMRHDEIEHVVRTVKSLCRKHGAGPDVRRQESR